MLLPEGTGWTGTDDLAWEPVPRRAFAAVPEGYCDLPEGQRKAASAAMARVLRAGLRGTAN
jgi:hypothetical protein